MLSYNDDGFVKNLYSGFNIREVSRANNLGKEKYSELLISNY